MPKDQTVIEKTTADGKVSGFKENKTTLSNDALLCTLGRGERDRAQTRPFSDGKGQNRAVFISQTKSKGKSGSSISRESVALHRPTTREKGCQRVHRTALHKKGVLFYIHTRSLSVVDVFMCCVGFHGDILRYAKRYIKTALPTENYSELSGKQNCIQ